VKSTQSLSFENCMARMRATGTPSTHISSESIAYSDRGPGRLCHENGLVGGNNFSMVRRSATNLS
jgi:hypothetical protein